MKPTEDNTFNLVYDEGKKKPPQKKKKQNSWQKINRKKNEMVMARKWKAVYFHPVCKARPKKIPLYFIRNCSILFGHFSCGGSLGAEIISHSRLFFPPSPFYVSCKTLKRNPLEIVAQTIECMKHTRRIEMKSWNTAVGVRRTQGTTSSWLHPFSFFFFLHHLCFFLVFVFYFYENNKWASLASFIP